MMNKYLNKLGKKLNKENIKWKWRKPCDLDILFHQIDIFGSNNNIIIDVVWLIEPKFVDNKLIIDRESPDGKYEIGYYRDGDVNSISVCSSKDVDFIIYKIKKLLKGFEI